MTEIAAGVRARFFDVPVSDVPRESAPPEEGGPPSGVDHHDHPLRRLLRSAAQSLLDIRTTLMGG